MHLSPETALDLVEGRVGNDQQQFWDEHLQTCTDCSNELEGWRTMGNLIKRSHLESAPRADFVHALAIFPKSEAVPVSKVRKLIADLVFDSFSQPAFAGARGTVEARQVVLRAEEFDIHVKIWGDQDHKQLMGQLLPRTSTEFVQNARLHLLRNGERFESTGADDLGEFHFADIPDGLLSLQIDLPHLTVIGALNVTEIQ